MRKHGIGKVSSLLPCLLGAAVPVLGFTGLWLGSGKMGPREAKASGAAVVPVTVDIPALARMNERERQIRESLSEIAARPLGASPIENPPPPAEVEVAAVPEPAAAPGVPEPTIRLSGFFSGREVMATLNGKVRRIGDEVEPGWKLVEINRAENSVVVEHKVGGRRVVRR